MMQQGKRLLSSLTIGMKPNLGLVGRFSNAFKTRPMTMNMALSGSLMCVGDICAQKIEHLGDNFKVNWVRVVIMGSWGSVLFGPALSKWFQFIDRTLSGRNLATVLQKVLIQAIVFVPPLNAAFFSYSTSLEYMLSRPFYTWKAQEMKNEVKAKIKQDLVPVVYNSARVWMPINVLNWLFVPNHVRVLFTSLVSVGWNCYISLVQHKEEPSLEALRH